MSNMFGKVYKLKTGCTLNILNEDVSILSVPDDVYDIGYTSLAIGEFDIQCKTLIVVGGVNVFSMNYAFANNVSIKRIDLRFFDMQKIWSMSSAFAGCINLEEILFGQYELHKLSSMSRAFNDCRSLRELDLQCVYTDDTPVAIDATFGRCYRLERLNLKNISNLKLDTGGYYYNFLHDCVNLKEVISDNEIISNVWKKHLKYMKNIKAERDALMG